MSLPTIRRLAAVLVLNSTFCVTPSFADGPGATGGSATQHPVTGEQVYQAVCQACHMANAKGATGAGTIPALADNPNVGNKDYIITVITQGKHAMPWFSGILDQKQIAAVATYVRTHFGNRYTETVTQDDVAKLSIPQPTPEP
jgi:mono/diheme cytochrome c family protein